MLFVFSNTLVLEVLVDSPCQGAVWAFAGAGFLAQVVGEECDSTVDAWGAARPGVSLGFLEGFGPFGLEGDRRLGDGSAERMAMEFDDSHEDGRLASAIKIDGDETRKGVGRFAWWWRG